MLPQCLHVAGSQITVLRTYCTQGANPQSRFYQWILFRVDNMDDFQETPRVILCTDILPGNEANLDLWDPA